VNTTHTPRVHHAYTTRTPWEHRGNTTRTPCEHHANTNQKTVWDLKFGREQFKQNTEFSGNNSNRIQNSAGTIQTEYRIRREQFKQNTDFGGNNSNRIRAGTIQTELDSNRIRAGTFWAGTIQTEFGREQFKQNSGGPKRILESWFRKTRPTSQPQDVSRQSTKMGNKNVSLLWKSIFRSFLSTTPFTTYFTT
jgi:hypothetical protein